MSEPGLRTGPPRRRSRGWIYLLLLLALGLGVYFFAWPRAQAWWAATFQDADEPAPAAAADPLATRVDALQARLERDRTANDTVLSGLRGSLSQVQRQMSASTTGEARLAEIEHLVAAARERAELDLDHRTALRLLVAADTLMLESGDPRYAPARVAIASDVAGVKAQLAIDVDGAYARLSQLSSAVAALPLRRVEYRADAQETPRAADGWWGRTVDTLGGLVRVRTDHTAADVPLLTRDGQAIVRQRVGLAFDHAATALLRGDSAQLVAALARADALVQQHADSRAPQVVALRSTVAGMRETPPVRAPVKIAAVAALAELPRPTPPGLLPSPESFGTPSAPALEDVPRVLPAEPSAPAAPVPSGPAPVIRPNGTGVSL